MAAPSSIWAYLKHCRQPWAVRVGRQHFERALAISNERNLIVKVCADQYGRLMFDRDLHDRLLNEVMAAPATAPGLTLMNTVAKERAQQLLDSADDYF